MAVELGAPPVLSTPDSHILNDTLVATTAKPEKKPLDDELSTRYEIQRTVDEIRQRKWRRVALQFPDEMLPDSARVFQLLARGLRPAKGDIPQPPVRAQIQNAEISESVGNSNMEDASEPVKLTILADTSYGACCVDEIGAEHVEADAVVHYGRACLSPTARLPTLYVFTKRQLDSAKVVECFTETFPDKFAKILVMADVTYAECVPHLCDAFAKEGYSNIGATSVIHDPSSPVPNRALPQSTGGGGAGSLKDWQLFHISEPPTSLLLTLSSRVAAIHIYPAQQINGSAATTSLLASTALVLRRRYALVTSLATVSIWGILINTLSVKNYLHMVDYVRDQIAAAGKKSYLFVVGKLNAAKVANFSEIGGWVVIGCWESSLVDSKDFYKPVITPFELELALKKDKDRLWTGQWRGDFQAVLDQAVVESGRLSTRANGAEDGPAEDLDHAPEPDDDDSEEESAPPDFDLRTGRYVSQSRPMQTQRPATAISQAHQASPTSALTRRAKGNMVAINGVASPGAEYLRAMRTWQGLGSDFEVAYEEEGAEHGSTVQEGRTGIARGYTVADSGRT